LLWADQLKTIHEEEPIATDRFLEVRRSDIELPNGERLDGYLTLTEGDSVHTVAITPEHEILLVRQYRYGIDHWTYECPAGFLEEEDNDPLDRAKCELREETGYEAEQWRALGVANPVINSMRKTEYS
jgi:8-oxo-dGTP pyrophosphatase MutT (NUDIX family)